MLLVTAPTGDIGRQVVADLLASGRDDVRVVVRDAARLPEDVRDRVEVVEGSHGDAAVVDRAFREIETLLWIVPPDPRAASVDEAYVGFSRPAADAVRRLGVGRVVTVTALGRGLEVADHAGYVTASLAMDDLFTSTGAAYRALTMPSFMDNLLGQAPSIAEGAFFSVVGPSAKDPTVATRDIARVAARLLADGRWSGQGSVPVLGPEDLSNEDLARTMTEVLGFPVRFEQLEPAAFRRSLVERGMSEAMADGMVDMSVAKDRGLDHSVERTPQAALNAPTTFRAWCEDVLRPAVSAVRS